MVARRRKKGPKQPKVRVVVRALVRDQERKLLAKIRSKACSEPWVWAQVKFSPAVDEEGDALEILDYRAGQYPVPGMIQCRGCERWTPPQCIGSSGHCDDCRLGAMSKLQLSRLQGSTSTVNLAKVKCAIRRGATTNPGGV